MSNNNNEAAQAFLAMAENLAMVVDTVSGYRAKCEEAGFSPTAAEVMSVDMHRGLISMLFPQAAPPTKEK